MKIVLSSEEALLIEVFDLFWEFERKKNIDGVKKFKRFDHFLCYFYIIKIFAIIDYH